MRICAAAERPLLDDDLVICADNAVALSELPHSAFDLIYLDPPFNTGRSQARQTLSVQAAANGVRVGFSGRRYSSRLLRNLSYDDGFGDYLAFLESRRARASVLLAPHGTPYFQLDYRLASYCKLPP